MSKVNWQALKEKTLFISKDVRQDAAIWFKAHPDWSDGELIFMDYPPRFVGIFHLHGVNSLSDKRLSEIGELATLLCTKYGLNGRKYVHDNTIEYKFSLPIKETL